jgi:hypothetical protein
MTRCLWPAYFRTEIYFNLSGVILDEGPFNHKAKMQSPRTVADLTHFLPFIAPFLPLAPSLSVFVLGFELRALSLLGKHSITWATPLVIFGLGYFSDRSCATLPRLAWNCKPPIYAFHESGITGMACGAQFPRVLFTHSFSPLPSWLLLVGSQVQHYSLIQGNFWTKHSEQLLSLPRMTAVQGWWVRV